MTNHATKIQTPDDPRFDSLCAELSASADQIDNSPDWPQHQLDLCSRYGVFEWFLDTSWGGQAWGQEDLLQAYIRLAEVCLTTTFIITQRQAACSRIAASQNSWLKNSLLPGLRTSEIFTTVGISHLSTSRRFLAEPPLVVSERLNRFQLTGYSPWVTGAAHANVLVVGATMANGEHKGQQVLLAVPTEQAGVSIDAPAKLVALSASHTALARFHEVELEKHWLIAGPMENVMKFAGSGTGGLQTSALAIGLSSAAIGHLERNSAARPELVPPAEALRSEWLSLKQDMLGIALGTGACNAEEVRVRSNSLVLRATQAALTAAKGVGFMAGHPVGRWCREALFFLVWSCPQPVAESNLCELAGL